MQKDQNIDEANILADDRHCFACGKTNSIGLKLGFTYKAEKANTSISFNVDHQGWVGVVHGGLVSTVLDECMAHTIRKHIGSAVTASMNVRFRRPVPVGELILFVGEIVRRRGKVIETRASAILPDQTVAAEATAIFMLI